MVHHIRDTMAAQQRKAKSETPTKYAPCVTVALVELEKIHQGEIYIT
jgi:hypothetical protein